MFRDQRAKGLHHCSRLKSRTKNLDDHSYSVAPELLHTGITNLEPRLRVFFLCGARLSDFGEERFPSPTRLTYCPEIVPG